MPFSASLRAAGQKAAMGGLTPRAQIVGHHQLGDSTYTAGYGCAW